MSQYKIIIAKNNRRIKTIKTYKYPKACFNKFELLMEQSNNVVIPKRFNTHNGLHLAKYYLICLKWANKKSDDPFLYKNEWGVTEKIQLKDKNWKIIKVHPWNFEETFYVYGKKGRLNCLEIYEQCLLPQIHYFTQIVKYFNKIVIDDGDFLEVILCKNEMDCQLLYQKLYTFAQHQNLSSLLFVGDASFDTRKALRDRLIKFTGLNVQEFYRKVSKSHL